MAEYKRNTEVRESLIYYLMSLRSSKKVYLKNGIDHDAFVDHYLNTLDKLEDLLSLTDELYQKDSSGKYITVTKKKGEELKKLYAEAIDLCDSLVDMMDSRFRSESMVPIREVTNLLKKDYLSLSSIDFSEVNTLPNLIEKSRSEKVSIAGVKTNVFGGQMSQRVLISIDGKKGYFTRSVRYNYDEAYDRMVKEMKEYFGPNGLGANEEAYAMTAVFDTSLRNEKDKSIKAMMVDGKAIVDVVKKNKMEMFYSFFSADAHTSGAFKDFMRVFLAKCKPVMTEFYQHNLVTRSNPDDDVNIAEKNCAMSAMDSLLGINLLAKSSHKTIVNGTEIIEGVFMENAEGIDINNTDNEQFFPAFGGKDIFSADGLKAIHDLEVLDYICGNTDRHGANMIYKCDKNNKIVGVTGIDNDGSFGLRVDKPNESGGNGSPLNDIRYVSADVAERIKTLTFEKLKTVLIGYGLNNREIDAAWKRTRMMQDRILYATDKEFKTQRDKDLEDYRKLSKSEQAEYDEQKGYYIDQDYSKFSVIDDPKQWNKIKIPDNKTGDNTLLERIQIARYKGGARNVESRKAAKAKPVSIISSEGLKTISGDIDNMIQALRNSGLPLKKGGEAAKKKLITQMKAVKACGTELSKLAKDPNADLTKMREALDKSLNRMAESAKILYSYVNVRQMSYSSQKNSAGKIMAPLESIYNYAVSKDNMLRGASGQKGIEEREISLSNAMDDEKYTKYVTERKVGFASRVSGEKYTKVKGFKRSDITVEYGNAAKEHYDTLLSYANKTLLTEEEKAAIRNEMAYVMMFNLVENAESTARRTNDNKALEEYEKEYKKDGKEAIKANVQKLIADPDFIKTVRNINPVELREFLDTDGSSMTSKYMNRSNLKAQMAKKIGEKGKGSDVFKRFEELEKNKYLDESVKANAYLECMLTHYLDRWNIREGREVSPAAANVRIKQLLGNRQFNVIVRLGMHSKNPGREIKDEFLATRTSQEPGPFESLMGKWFNEYENDGFDFEAQFEERAKNANMPEEQAKRLKYSYKNLCIVNTLLKGAKFESGKTADELFAMVYNPERTARKPQAVSALKALKEFNKKHDALRVNMVPGYLNDVHCYYMDTTGSVEGKKNNKYIKDHINDDTLEGARLRREMSRKYINDVLAVPNKIIAPKNFEEAAVILQNHPREYQLLSMLSDFMKCMGEEITLPQDVSETLKKRLEVFKNLQSYKDECEIYGKDDYLMGTILKGQDDKTIDRVMKNAGRFGISADVVKSMEFGKNFDSEKTREQAMEQLSDDNVGMKIKSYSIGITDKKYKWQFEVLNRQESRKENREAFDFENTEAALKEFKQQLAEEEQKRLDERKVPTAGTYEQMLGEMANKALSAGSVGENAPEMRGLMEKVLTALNVKDAAKRDSALSKAYKALEKKQKSLNNAMMDIQTGDDEKLEQQLGAVVNAMSMIDQILDARKADAAFEKLNMELLSASVKGIKMINPAKSRDDFKKAIAGLYVAGKVMEDYLKTGAKGRLETADVKSEILELAKEPAMEQLIKDPESLKIISNIQKTSKPKSDVLKKLCDSIDAKRMENKLLEQKELEQNELQDGKNGPDQAQI